MEFALERALALLLQFVGRKITGLEAGPLTATAREQKGRRPKPTP